MTKFKIEFPEKFEIDICFNVYINDVLYNHQICQSFDGKYYLYCRHKNDIIFDLLHIDKYDFMRKFFGIESSRGWPEVDTLNMLKYQLECLKYYEEF